MSIASIINTATTGLSVAQTRIALASTNLANVETPGYTAKTASVATRTVGGQATGVQVVGIGSDVDANLHKKLVSSIATSSYDSTISSYLQAASAAFGTTSDGADLTNALAKIQTTLSDVIADPADTSVADAFLSALESWADTVNTTSDTIQSSRTTADAAIAEDVESANALLHQIDTLNDQITRAIANGTPTSDLEDARRAALESLGQYIDVTTFTTNAGAVQIYAGGQPLLTSHVYELTYAASGELNVDSTYPGSIGGITVNGVDVTKSLSGGSIGALVKLRDEVLPGLQDEIEALNNGVMDAINAAAATATPVPAPNTLTSSATYVAADALNGTGTLTLVLTDADGVVTGSVDFDLSTYATMGDLVAALDGTAGISASLDATGHLVVAADDADAGVILTGAGTLDGAGFNRATGVYDLLSLDYGLTLDYGRVQLAPQVATSGMAMAAVASTTVGASAYAADDTTALQAIYDALSKTMSFGSAGNLSATTTTAAGYAARIVDDLADRADQAAVVAKSSATTASTLETSFTNTYGVSVEEETARLATYQKDFQAASQILQAAQDMWDSLISVMR